MIVSGFEKLRIWQQGHTLLRKILQIIERIPRSESLPLKNQIQRSAASVGANIAEGYAAYYYKNKIKSFYIARMEAAETQNHIRALEAKNYVSGSQADHLIDQYQTLIKGINAYIKYLRQKQPPT